MSSEGALQQIETAELSISTIDAASSAAMTALALARRELGWTGPVPPPPPAGAWEFRQAGPLVGFNLIPLPGVPDAWGDWEVDYDLAVGDVGPVGDVIRAKQSNLRCPGEWAYDSEYQLQDGVYVAVSDRGIDLGRRTLRIGLDARTTRLSLRKVGAVLTTTLDNGDGPRSIEAPALATRTGMGSTVWANGASPKDVAKGRSIDTSGFEVRNLVVRVWPPA